MQTCTFFASLFFPELPQLLPFIEIWIAFWVKCDVVRWKLSTEIQTRLEYLTISIKLQVCLLPKMDFWLRGTWEENNAPDFRAAFLKSMYACSSQGFEGWKGNRKKKKIPIQKLGGEGRQICLLFLLLYLPMSFQYRYNIGQRQVYSKWLLFLKKWNNREHINRPAGGTTVQLDRR